MTATPTCPASPADPVTVSIYCRLSLDREGSGLGVQRQEAECRAFAEARGWTIGAVFVDNDASATTGRRRPAFEALLASKPEAVLCWHLDRLVRVSRDLEPILDLGCNVYTVQAGDVNLSTPTGRAVARTIVAWATNEVELKTARQLASNRQRAARGGSPWVNRPFGYNMDRTVNESEAKLVRQAYRDALNGKTFTEIAREWAGSPHNAGRAWTYKGVRQLLMNPRNAGLVAYRGEIVGKAEWEPLVSEEMWRAVLPKRSRSGRNSGVKGTVTRLCSGLVICEKCRETAPDAPLAEVTFRIGRGGVEYNCRKFHTSITVDWLDSLVWTKALEELPRARAAWTGPGPNDDKVVEIRASLEALEGRMHDLGAAYAAGSIPLATLTAAADAAAKTRAELQAELDAAVRSNFEPVRVMAAAAGGEFAYLSPQALMADEMSLGQRRAYIAAVFSEVSVAPRAYTRQPLAVEHVTFRAR